MTTKLSVVMRTNVGRVREGNEDAVLAADLGGGTPIGDGGAGRLEVGMRGVLLAVSDGMGGHKAGEVASALTLDSLFRTLVERVSLLDADERIRTAVEQANQDVLEAGQRPSFARMGATLTAVLVEGTNAHVAGVGDSRAYLLRGGALRQVTEDQSYVQQLVSAGTMTPEEASASPWRHVLLQAIGQGPDLTVALGTLALRDGDLLVLCSDGLTGHLSDRDIRDEILAMPTLAAACDRLIAVANERGGEDNITVLLAGVSGDVPAVAAGERISETFEVVRSFEPGAGHWRP